MQGVVLHCRVLRCVATRHDATRSGGTMSRGSKQPRPGNVVKEDHWASRMTLPAMSLAMSVIWARRSRPERMSLFSTSAN